MIFFTNNHHTSIGCMINFRLSATQSVQHLATFYLAVATQTCIFYGIIQYNGERSTTTKTNLSYIQRFGFFIRMQH